MSTQAHPNLSKHLRDQVHWRLYKQRRGHHAMTLTFKPQTWNKDVHTKCSLPGVFIIHRNWSKMWPKMKLLINPSRWLAVSVLLRSPAVFRVANLQVLLWRRGCLWILITQRDVRSNAQIDWSKSRRWCVGGSRLTNERMRFASWIIINHLSRSWRKVTKQRQHYLINIHKTSLCRSRKSDTATMEPRVGHKSYTMGPNNSEMP